MANGLFDMLTSSATGLFIGKKWPTSEVGYYNRAEKVTQTVGVETYNIISGILLPTFSSYQQDEQRLKDIVRKITALSCYIMFPLMLGLALCSKAVVTILLTDKWLPAVPLIQISCITGAMNPLRQLCMQVNYSVGRYKKNMQIECCRMAMVLSAIVVITLMHAPKLFFILLACSTVAVITAITYLISLNKAIGYTVREVVKDLFPIITIVCISMAPVVFLKQLEMPNILYLLISIASSIGVYLGLSACFKLEVFCYAVATLNSVVFKRNENGDKNSD
jgi:O-antigen/teichoic acid export membrane protein